jgi:hypothetical protein
MRFCGADGNWTRDYSIFVDGRFPLRRAIVHDGGGRAARSAAEHRTSIYNGEHYLAESID